MVARRHGRALERVAAHRPDDVREDVPAVARAAQPHIAEALPAGVFARLPLVEQARRVRQLPEPGEQAVLRPPLDGEPVALTPKEYDILYYLMQHPGKVYTPAELYSAVWNEAPVGIDNTVAVHIRHLREKLEIDPSNPRYLKVVWGKGYKLEGDRQ